MKKIIKNIVPTPLWNTLRYIKTYSFRSVGRVGFFKILKIAKREYGGTFGVLDYPKNKISIFLSSFEEIARLTPQKKEPKTVLWIEKNLRKGDIFFDIGANVGAYSFIAQAVTHGDSVTYAFEPNFLTFVSLSKNIIFNQVTNKIIPFCVALSDSTKLSGFSYSDLSAGSAQHNIHDHIDESDTNIQPIIVYKLDDFIRTFNITPPNAMKIDVDGAELSVLEGSRNTLSTAQLRSVIVEIDTRNATHVNAIEKIMTEAGFTMTEKHPLGKGSSTTLFNCVFNKRDSK